MNHRLEILEQGSTEAVDESAGFRPVTWAIMDVSRA
jgi:hypothetical protein